MTQADRPPGAPAQTAGFIHAHCTTTAMARQSSGSKKSKSSRPGLYANIQAKRHRIARGSGEKMRKPGSEGAPSEKAFEQSAKTAKPRNKSTRHHRSRRARSRHRKG